ncbi:MAG: hydrogenase maturation nickel metallochaperone HypA [Bacteroidales bacterium]|nr:hydrogenase maturation nickel metallochaperone HypA [Candidatus Cacconaster caballi]
MHELGIVFYIIRDVKKVAEENHCGRISKVVMDIGEVSTVVPHLLTDCWEWAVKKEELLEGCRLEINTTPAVTFCEDCKREYDTVKHGKTCPYCKGGNTWLLRGNEVEIKEIEVSGSDGGAPET